MPVRTTTASKMPTLGELEIAVLEHVWANAGPTAKSVHDHIGLSRNTSLNTVQSALERLHRKGLLSREKHGHSYVYSAMLERDALIARYIGSLLGTFSTDASSALAAFIDAADDISAEELERLEGILRQRRKSSSA